MSDEIIDKELREEFKRDFLDQLQEVERLLLILEKDPGNMDTVREIFRPFHTIKGNAGVIGEYELQDISQLSESILDQVRSGGRQLTQKMIDEIFQSVDVIRQLIESHDITILSDRIEQTKKNLTAVILGDEKKAGPSIAQRGKPAFIESLDPDKARVVLSHLDQIDKKVTRCKLDRNFSPSLFDLFDHALELSVLLTQQAKMPHAVAALKYLETYLTILNTTDIQYSTETWSLMDLIRSDIIRQLYPVLINSLSVGVCYFNPEDTVSDLEKQIDWLMGIGKKAIIINLNRAAVPVLDDIHHLVRLKKEKLIPIVYIQRFLGHKMYWQDIMLLMENPLVIHSSFWRALVSFVPIFSN